MKKIAIILSLLVASFLIFAGVRAADQPKIYLVPVSYNSGQLSFGSIRFIYGFGDEIKNQAQLPPARYWVELVSFSGQSLEKRQFGISLQAMSSQPAPGEKDSGPDMTILKKTSLVLALPYHGDGKMLYLSDANSKRLAEADVSKFADYCGDKICRSPETAKTCPADCPAAAAVWPAWLNVVIFIAITGIIIIALAAGYIFWRKKQRNSIPPNNQL